MTFFVPDEGGSVVTKRSYGGDLGQLVTQRMNQEVVEGWWTEEPTPKYAHSLHRVLQMAERKNHEDMKHWAKVMELLKILNEMEGRS